MAKVDGPLLSIEARGKIADAIVYFPWKGRHVVRQWLKPTNPQSTLQGYLRAAMKAVGKAIKQIVSKSQGGALDSKVYTLATSSVPAGLNWNAWLGQGYLDGLQSAGTFKTASFTADIVAYSSLNTTDLAAWASNATALGMEDFAFNYGYTTNLAAGCQLYFLAIGCYKNSLYATAPYNTAPASWVVSDIDSFKTDMVATD